MYTAVIIDDEKHIRNGLKNCIPWHDLGIRVSGTAANGIEACELIDTAKPDIIITDIRMPGMDGLELIKHIRKQACTAKVIILSAYNDFSYAKQAIRFGVSDYLLKPIDEQELLSTIEACIGEIESADTIRSQDMEAAVQQRQQMLHAVIFQEHDDQQALYELFEQSSIDVNVPAAVIVLHASPLPNVSESCHTPEMNYSELFIDLNRVLEHSGAGYESFLDDENRIVLVQSLREESADKSLHHIKELLSSWMQETETRVQCRISAGIGTPADILSISESYMQGVRAVEYRMVDAMSRIHHFEPSAKNTRFNPFRHKENIFLNSIKTGDVRLMEAELDTVFDDIDQAKDTLDPYFLKETISGFIARIIDDVRTISNTDERIKSKKSVSQAVWNAASLKELKSCMFKYLSKEAEKLSLKTSVSSIIQQAHEYIQNNFHKHITVHEISRELLLHPNYFSSLYAEVMGERCSTYIAKVRIEKAKELIDTTCLKIYEIADKVGYPDFRQFTKTFKKIEGITPKEYKTKRKVL